MCQSDSSCSSSTSPTWSFVFLGNSISSDHELFQPATVTSIERKFHVHPHIAEFYCTITSFAFALPLLVLIYPPPGGLEFTTVEGMKSIPIEAPLILSFMTAVFSTLYHWTLWKLFSSLDAACAIMTFYSASLVTMEAAGHVPQRWVDIESFPGYASRQVQFTVAFLVAMLFWHSWRKTAVPSVILFALCLPIPLWNLWLMGSPESYISIVVAVSFFLLDRLKIAATHPLWHLVGGYSLYLCFYNSLAYHNERHLGERSQMVDHLIEGFSAQ